MKISTVTLATQYSQIIQDWSHKKNLGRCIMDQYSLKMEHLGKCKKKPGTDCMSRARFLIHSLMEVLVKGDIASNELRPLGRKKIKKFRLNSSSVCHTAVSVCSSKLCSTGGVCVLDFPSIVATPAEQGGSHCARRSNPLHPSSLQNTSL